MTDTIPCKYCPGTAEYFAPGRSHKYYKCNRCGETMSEVAEAYK